MRRGAAIPMVLFVLVIVLPVAAALFVRSSQSASWMGKLQAQGTATALAEEGEHAALEALRANGGAGSGDRPTADGGLTWNTWDLPAGRAGQAQYLIASEGLHLGESRLLVTIAEVTNRPTATLVIPRDRLWQPEVAGPVDQTSLAAAHQARVDRYLARLAAEQALGAGAYSAALNGTLAACDWPVLSPRLDATKVPPGAGLLPALAQAYQDRYLEYRARLAAGDAAGAETEHAAFVQALRVYQIAAR